MTRSIWKGKFIYNFLLKREFLKRHKKIVWTRNSAIPAALIGKYVFIHTGKSFIKVFINREKVGFKFGAFAFTRKFTKKEKAKIKPGSKKKKK